MGPLKVVLLVAFIVAVWTDLSAECAKSPIIYGQVDETTQLFYVEGKPERLVSVCLANLTSDCEHLKVCAKRVWVHSRSSRQRTKVNPRLSKQARSSQISCC